MDESPASERLRVCVCVCCDGSADCRQRDSSVLLCSDDDATIYSVEQGSVPVTQSKARSHCSGFMTAAEWRQSTSLSASWP